MSQRPRILFYTTQPAYPYWGGSEKYWYELLCDARVRERFECHVQLPDSPVTRGKGAHLQSLGVEVQWYAEIYPGLVERAIRKLQRKVLDVRPAENDKPWFHHIETLKPALVWFNVASLNTTSRLDFATEICRKNGIPYWIIVQHAPEHYFPYVGWDAEGYRKVLTGAKRVVYVSKRNLATIERALGEKLANAWQGCNAVPRAFIERLSAAAGELPVTSGGTARLLSLAREDLSAKGQHILLEVLSDPRWADRDWHLTLQGVSPDGLVRRLVDYFGISPDRVTVQDSTPDVVPVICRSDLLIMPSLSEGTPFAMVEAMIGARPAVGTPAGGIPELIQEGQTGWLARSTEVPDVADALERAWAQRKSWRDVGQRAQAAVIQQYDQDTQWPRVIDALAEDIA